MGTDTNLQDLLPERVKKLNLIGLKPKQLQMLIGIDTCLGSVLAAAEKSGIHRATHYRWLQTDANYKAAFTALTTVTHEWTDAKILELYKENELKEAMFLLSIRGKHRGYRLTDKQPTTKT
jgi:hypothetical protein